MDAASEKANDVEVMKSPLPGKCLFLFQIRVIRVYTRLVFFATTVELLL